MYADPDFDDDDTLGELAGGLWREETSARGVSAATAKASAEGPAVEGSGVRVKAEALADLGGATAGIADVPMVGQPASRAASVLPPAVVAPRAASPLGRRSASQAPPEQLRGSRPLGCGVGQAAPGTPVRAPQPMMGAGRGRSQAAWLCHSA
jgi:hypothetical protein